jgi:predicted  nucleic acid-binding Zn-ribbon protein
MKSKFAKQDDVMLDREISSLRKQIAKLTEWHSDLSKRLSASVNKIFERLETIEKEMEK